MMTTKQDADVNIHHFLRIKIDPEFPWKQDWLRGIDDIGKLSGNQSEDADSIFEIVYKPNLLTLSWREHGNGIYVKPTAVLDTKYGAILESPSLKQLVLTANKPCLEWFAPALQIMLLRKNAVLMHCAAVEKSGKAILFPSWGGIGKTALVAGFVKKWGWKFLGDDFIILDGSGTCYGFPKPMVIYPYHSRLFPEVFSAGQGPIAPLSLNHWLSRVAIRLKPVLRSFPRILQFARKHNPQSSRVSPSRIFGHGQLSVKARLGGVIWLDRVAGLAEPKVSDTIAPLYSRIMGSTLHEFDQRCLDVINISMGTNTIDTEAFYGAWISVLRSGISEVVQKSICLPETLPVEEVPLTVRTVLENSDLWV